MKEINIKTKPEKKKKNTFLEKLYEYQDKLIIKMRERDEILKEKNKKE